MSVDTNQAQINLAQVTLVDVNAQQFDPDRLQAAIARFRPLLSTMAPAPVAPTAPVAPVPPVPKKLEPPQSIQLPRLRLQVYDRLDSTSDRLRQIMDQGAPAGTAVLALAQIKGRGQQGRSWVSESGGLYLSVGLRPDLPAPEGARLSLGSAWGVATVFQAVGIPVELKWPNDLLLRIGDLKLEQVNPGQMRPKARKLGGILTESRLRGDRIYQVIIGIGMNWNNHPPEPGIALKPWLDRALPHSDAPCTASTSPQPVLKDRNPLRITSLEGLAALAWTGLLAGCQRWQDSSRSLEELVQDYERLIKATGRSVQIGSEWGMITGIATTGELKVRGSAGTLLFPPGAIRLGYD